MRTGEGENFEERPGKKEDHTSGVLNWKGPPLEKLEWAAVRKRRGIFGRGGGGNWQSRAGSEGKTAPRFKLWGKTAKKNL